MGFWIGKFKCHRLDTETLRDSSCWGTSASQQQQNKSFIPLNWLVYDQKPGHMDFFCLNKWHLSEAFVFLISPICMLDILQICISSHLQRFSISRWKERHALPLTRFPLLNKSNASQGNLIETLRDLCSEQIGQELGSEPVKQWTGRPDRSASYLYPISIMLTWSLTWSEMGFTVWWMGHSLEQAAGVLKIKGQLYTLSVSDTMSIN